jgi:signal transduction histidine kinase
MNRAAHNLRAPLVAMASMLEVVQDGYMGDTDDKLQKHLFRIDQRVQNMLLMIDELMTLAKSQSKQRRLEYRPVDLKVVTDRIHQTFQEKAGQKNLSFKVIVPEDLPKIKGDQEMVEQMLENLVSNAIKYTPEGGHIGMTFWPGANETVRIVLSDSGIGIPKDEIPRLFTEFFRASNVKNVIGTGLGLTIVKEIVDQHGGQIQVESEEGLGTTFVIHLPFGPEEIVQS